MLDQHYTRSLRELFAERIFLVPDYQRGYSWDSSNVKDLLSDLDNLPVEKYHYTGTVVLHEQSPNKIHDSSGTPLQTSAIVDGQQRLTTLVILLNCIRRRLHLLDADSDMASFIQKRFIATEGRDGQPLPKLKLNLGTDLFFHDNVLSDAPGGPPPSVSPEKRLRVAKDAIEKHLSTKLAEDPTRSRDILEDLYLKVSDRLRFSLYEVEREAEVGVIFEVMNDRGKSLSELEKVKNYLLYASTVLPLADKLASRVNEAWKTILTQLMSAALETSDDENTLLRTHWVTAYDHRTRNWRRAKSVKERFDLRTRADRDPKHLLGDLLTYTKDLAQTSVPFSDAYAPRQSTAFGGLVCNSTTRSQIVEWSEKLRRMNTLAIFVPILIAVRKRYPSDADKYLRLLQLCEKYAFRVFALRESRTDAGQATLFGTAYKITKGEIVYEDAVTALQAELSWRCSDEEFASSLRQRAAAANWYEWRPLKYFLYEYEIDLAKRRHASPQVSWQDLGDNRKETVEHVLPQTPSPYWTTRFIKEQHARHLNNLGNLTLTRGNSVLSNKSFPDKKGSPGAEKYCYAVSPLFVERDLTRWEEWTPQTIEQRQEELLAWARGRWSQ